MSTLKAQEAATSAPANAVEFVAAHADTIARYQVELTSAHKDHGFVYEAGTWTDHTASAIQELCYEILHLEPRVTKKEAQFALNIQGPDRVTAASNAYAKAHDLNGHRVVRAAPFRPLGSLPATAATEGWVGDVLAEQAAKQAEAAKAAKPARQPRQRKTA